MATEAHTESERELFRDAREKFDEIVAGLMQQAPQTLAESEEHIWAEALELQRRLLQARLDVLFERERADVAAHPAPPGVERRVRHRQIESKFSRVVQRRHGLKEEGEAARFPMDEELNLPADLYSHPLRRRVAEEVADGSFDHAVAQIERTTGGHVPKRQAQQLTARASQDVEAFYEQRAQPANDTLSDEALLAMSSDGCGLRMTREGLREPTRRAAEKAEQDAEEQTRGDPTAAAPIPSHQTRRAVVTAVWEQERHDRTAEDVVANLERQPNEAESRRKARGPRPQNKRLTASVEQDQRERITEMFDEADRRDPERERKSVALVDGDEHQTAAIKEEAYERDRSLTIVLDLLHAMHYLWVAASAITAWTRGTKADTQALVTRWTILLLTSEPARAIAVVRATATREGLRGKAREAVDGAANYLLKRTPYLNYASFIAEGLPIATGVIEGACRFLVRDRLGITGARWNVTDAEAVLRLRAVRASGDWEEYWAFHLEQEALRNYADAA